MKLDQTRPFVRDPKYPTLNAHDRQMKVLFGLDPKAKWPTGGLPARSVQGIRMWVDSLDTARISHRFHRVKAECPLCGKVFSAGRLHQHKCHAELNRGVIEALYGPILNVWQAIAPDAECDDNLVAMELCIDADRLTTFGEKVADDYVGSLIKKYGYSQVLKYLAANIPLV